MEPGCKLNRKEKDPHHYKVMIAVLLSGRTPQPRQILSLLCIEISNSTPLGMLRGFCHAQHLRNTHATRTQHACCVTTQRCILQYSVPAGCKKVELCLEGWLSRKCVGEGAKYRKLQRCAAAQHAMLRGCCVHVAYDETHATL